MGLDGKNWILSQNSDSTKAYAEHLIKRYGKNGQISARQTKKLLFGDKKLTQEQKNALKQFGKLDGEKSFTSQELQTLISASLISDGTIKSTKALEMDMNDIKSIFGFVKSDKNKNNTDDVPLKPDNSQRKRQFSIGIATATTEDGDWNKQITYSTEYKRR